MSNLFLKQGAVVPVGVDMIAELRPPWLPFEGKLNKHGTRLFLACGLRWRV